MEKIFFFYNWSFVRVIHQRLWILHMKAQECLQHIHVMMSSPPGKNGRHFSDDSFKCIFVNEKFCILIEISLKYVPKGPLDNNPALV